MVHNGYYKVMSNSPKNGTFTNPWKTPPFSLHVPGQVLGYKDIAQGLQWHQVFGMRRLLSVPVSAALRGVFWALPDGVTEKWQCGEKFSQKNCDSMVIQWQFYGDSMAILW